VTCSEMLSVEEWDSVYWIDDRGWTPRVHIGTECQP
jgi:hypothetical protein